MFAGAGIRDKIKNQNHELGQNQNKTIWKPEAYFRYKRLSTTTIVLDSFPIRLFISKIRHKIELLVLI